MADYLDYLMGLGETGATLGSGAMAGLLGMPYGVYKGATSGKLGTREANRIAEEEARKFMEQYTYQPRGKVAPEMMQTLGGLLESSKLPPVIPEAAVLASIPRQAVASQAERAGMAAERAITPVVERTMQKGGLGAGLLSDLSQGTQSNVVKLPSKKVLGYDPQKLAERYPKVAAGVPAVDPKTGKEYIAKQLSAEAEAVQKARNAAQKDIEKGNYQPFFDVSQRAYVDPTNYPLQGRTLTDVVPAKQQTIDKYQAIYDTPQARANLAGAYEKAVNDPLAHNWYAMKQYEDQFIKQFGPEKGRQLFKERFADAMAATTGGADPKANFLMGQYGNFLRQKGIAQPSSAVDFPHPIGGRFASGNMSLYDKLINQGQGLTVQNPKRHNFSANFLGYRDRPTIDEQMSQLYQGGLLAPYPNTYGLAEGVLNDVAASKGIMPVNLQDVAWIGAKGATGKPMIQNINEAVERTSRITGLMPDEVMKKMLAGEIPTY